MAAIQRTTKQQIFDAVQDLHNREQMVTREVLRELTGLKLTIIDDRLATLVDDGELIRKSRGVFVPAVQRPPARPISKSILPDGLVKIEIGDEVLTLTPREDRTLASLQAGTAVEFAAIETGHEMSAMVAAMRQQMTWMQARLRELEGKDQMELGLWKSPLGGLEVDHCAGALPGRNGEQVAFIDLLGAQQEQPPKAEGNSLVLGFVPNPGAASDADDVGALELGEAVALPDGRHERGRRAGVDVVGGEGEHELLPVTRQELSNQVPGPYTSGTQSFRSNNSPRRIRPRSKHISRYLRSSGWAAVFIARELSAVFRRAISFICSFISSHGSSTPFVFSIPSAPQSWW